MKQDVPAPTALAQSVAARATADPRTAEAKRPEAALEALTLAAEGVSQTEIQSRTGLGKRTVRRLMADHREAMGEERLKASIRAAEAAELARSIAVQRLRMMDPSTAENDEEREQRADLLQKTNVRDLSVSYGIMTDKSEKLSDQPQPVSDAAAGPGLAEVMRLRVELAAGSDAEKAKPGAEQEREIQRRVQERLREMAGAENVVELTSGINTARSLTGRATAGKG